MGDPRMEPPVCGPRIRSSRWFLVVSTGLLVFLCLAVLLAGLLLLRRSSQPRLGQIAGNSMEPTLVGPRVLLPCQACAFENRFCMDAWQPGRPIKCLNCGQALDVPDDPILEAGQNVRYLPTLPWSRNHPRGPGGHLLRRGDIVVLERSGGPEPTDGHEREVKRIAGLPGERIAIQDGDLWIDGQRFQKDLTQFLQQAILVGHWTAGLSTTCSTLESFFDAFDHPINNDLPINAHDSITVLPVRDLGVSLRIARASPAWSLRLGWQVEDTSVHVKLDCNQGSILSVQLDSELLTRSEESATKRLADDAPLWLTIASVDGRVLISDGHATWIGERTLTVERSDMLAHNTSMRQSFLQFESLSGEIEFDRCLVYRDIHYRGYSDAPEQGIRAGEGYVVLGDNVSISNDSRGAGDASQRVPVENIRGLIPPDHVPLVRLLQRAERMPMSPPRLGHAILPE